MSDLGKKIAAFCLAWPGTTEDLDFSTLAELIRESYELVVAKLSKKAQRELGFNP